MFDDGDENQPLTEERINEIYARLLERNPSLRDQEKHFEDWKTDAVEYILKNRIHEGKLSNSDIAWIILRACCRCAISFKTVLINAVKPILNWIILGTKSLVEAVFSYNCDKLDGAVDGVCEASNTTFNIYLATGLFVKDLVVQGYYLFYG